ncbi:S-crystallin SL11 [Apostichopus japonicus]|uniref:S-crystallin SL11 n=1 Tax=Stichopus japonicus TaxID=307972 RepID=A0A2G8L8A7_STIJA|nr:S-crystallin SL11 [Apostichopus japonicus]
MHSLRLISSSSTGPIYRLIYFNLKGRAETSRMMFKVAGVEFEDFRIDQKRWAEFKHMAPQGILPVLEVNGKKLPQSGAINRYIARELGFYGCNNWEASRIDAVVETIGDCLHDLDIWWMIRDLDVRNKLQKHHEGKLIPKALARLDQLLEENSEGRGFLVGDKISLADIHAMNYIHDYLPTLHNIKAEDSFPRLGDHARRIAEVSQIKEWIKIRPFSKF